MNLNMHNENWNPIKVWSNRRRPNFVRTKAVYYWLWTDKVKHHYCLILPSSYSPRLPFIMKREQMHRFPPVASIFCGWSLESFLWPAPQLVSLKHCRTTRLCDVRSRASYFCAIALYWIINSKRWHFYSMSAILVHSCDFPQHSTTRHPAKIIPAFCSFCSFFPFFGGTPACCYHVSPTF